MCTNRIAISAKQSDYVPTARENKENGGTIGIPLKDGSRKTARYWVKVFEEESEGGIDGGKISKLSIRIDGEWVASYDSGWDVEPADDDEAAQLACGILINEYN